jgi:microcystin-dependent protein
MADPFVAEIRVFGFNFAPTGWASCDGQVLPISQNTALFSLLGTTYGGDGRTTFALPNLNQRFAMGAGQGPGLSPRDLGEVGGEAQVALSSAEMPAHTHQLMAAAAATTGSPASAGLAPPAGGVLTYRTPGTLATMASDSTAAAGGNQPHENRQPGLSLNFCIALQGVFPPRS